MYPQYHHHEGCAERLAQHGGQVQSTDSVLTSRPVHLDVSQVSLIGLHDRSVYLGGVFVPQRLHTCTI